MAAKKFFSITANGAQYMMIWYHSGNIIGNIQSLPMKNGKVDWDKVTETDIGRIVLEKPDGVRNEYKIPVILIRKTDTYYEFQTVEEFPETLHCIVKNTTTGRSLHWYNLRTATYRRVSFHPA